VLQSVLLTVDITAVVACNAEPPAIQMRAEDGTQVAKKKKNMPIPYFLRKHQHPQVSYVSLYPLFDTSV